MSKLDNVIDERWLSESWSVILKRCNLVKRISRYTNNGEATNRDREHAVTQARNAASQLFSQQHIRLLMKRGISNLVPEAGPLFR